MKQGILDAILDHVVIPEITRFFRERAAAGEPLPTDDEVRARLNTHADDVIATGSAFLASKGQN